MNEFRKKPKNSGGKKRNFLQLLIETGNLSKEGVASLMPFIILLFFLALIQISNRYNSEKEKREIETLTKELKEYRWEYLTRSADLMHKSKQTEVAVRVEELGLKESRVPPKLVELPKE
ncbi:MAG: hypothetical protein ACJAZ3_000294 [Sphingobacteriales bacterium]|jgi:hypothetical protein